MYFQRKYFDEFYFAVINYVVQISGNIARWVGIWNSHYDTNINPSDNCHTTL